MVHTNLADQIVRKVSPSDPIGLQTSSNQSIILDSELIHFKNLFQFGNQLKLSLTVATSEYPDQFTKNDYREKKWFAIAQAVCNDYFNGGKLSFVVGREVSNQNVRVQASHCLEKPSAIASFISLTETARFFFRDLTIPFNKRMSLLR